MTITSPLALECRECGTRYPVEALTICEECFGHPEPPHAPEPGALGRAKILATEAYGASVVAVKGNYDAVNRLCSEVAEALPWAFVNVNRRRCYAEGSKSLGFEVAEQLGGGLPAHVGV